MKTISFIRLLFSLFIVIPAYGQAFRKQFEEYTIQKDTAKQALVLTRWEKASPNDPELYVAQFNYYIDKGQRTLFSLGSKAEGDLALKIADSTGNVVGFIGNRTIYKQEDYEKGMQAIDLGIEKFPNRLDMRLGKIYVLNHNKDYPQVKEELMKTLDYSQINANDWLWSEGEKIKQGKAVMLEVVQNYVFQMYEDGMFDYMEEISRKVLTFYPDQVEFLSDLSIVYLSRKQYDKALEVLHSAEKLHPQDFIVLNNIAHTYKQKGDKDKAIKYYKLTLKYGDEDAKEQAKVELKSLRKK